MPRQSQPTVRIVGQRDWITHLLSEPVPAHWDAAVTTLSRLMAADAHELAPTVAAHLPDARTVLGDLAARRLDLENALLVVYGRVHGDGRVAGLPLPGVQLHALTAATQYFEIRDRVVRQLLGAIDEGTATTLTAQWSIAASNGATRPHPWLTRRRTQGSVGYHWASLWDRVRDTLDSRPTGASLTI